MVTLICHRCVHVCAARLAHLLGKAPEKINPLLLATSGGNADVIHALIARLACDGQEAGVDQLPAGISS